MLHPIKLYYSTIDPKTVHNEQNKMFAGSVNNEKWHSSLQLSKSWNKIVSKHHTLTFNVGKAPVLMQAFWLINRPTCMLSAFYYPVHSWNVLISGRKSRLARNFVLNVKISFNDFNVNSMWWKDQVYWHTMFFGISSICEKDLMKSLGKVSRKS